MPVLSPALQGISTTDPQGDLAASDKCDSYQGMPSQTCRKSCITNAPSGAGLRSRRFATGSQGLYLLGCRFRAFPSPDGEFIVSQFPRSSAKPKCIRCNQNGAGRLSCGTIHAHVGTDASAVRRAKRGARITWGRPPRPSSERSEQARGWSRPPERRAREQRLQKYAP